MVITREIVEQKKVLGPKTNMNGLWTSWGKMDWSIILWFSQRWVFPSTR